MEANKTVEQEFLHLEGAASSPTPAESVQASGSEHKRASPESPPETSRGDPAVTGPTTPVTASSEGVSRAYASSSGEATSSAEKQQPLLPPPTAADPRRRRPPALELWSPGSAHPLSPMMSSDGNSPSPAVRRSSEEPSPSATAAGSSSAGLANTSRAASLGQSSSVARSPTSYALSDAETEVFEDARSRAPSNASSLDYDAYYDAESDFEPSGPATDRSGALAQMQVTACLS